jgi:hypothetical protein
MPVILATAIRKVMAWSQPGQTVSETFFEKYLTQKKVYSLPGKLCFYCFSCLAWILLSRTEVDSSAELTGNIFGLWIGYSTPVSVRGKKSSLHLSLDWGPAYSLHSTGAFLFGFWLLSLPYPILFKDDSAMLNLPWVSFSSRCCLCLP